MDAHPTPFPGKRRPVAVKTTKKESYTKNKLSQETKSDLVSNNPRPKRAFGVPRSTNVQAERQTQKNLPAKLSKPCKPSGAPAKRSGKESAAPPVVGPTRKSKPDAKSTHHVCFLEQAKAKNVEKELVDDGLSTPVTLVKCIIPPETPYLSAKNCSNCRVDKFETCTYWLNQINLAEAVGKHFVSAAFFHLALECHAEPFHDLQSEFEHYVKRHESVSLGTLWSDLHEAYRSKDEKLSFGFQKLYEDDVFLVDKEEVKSGTKTNQEANHVTLEDQCLDFVYIDNLSSDIPGEEPFKVVDDDFVELKKDLRNKVSDIGKSILKFSENSNDIRKSSSDGKDSVMEVIESSSRLDRNPKAQKSALACNDTMPCFTDKVCKLSGGTSKERRNEERIDKDGLLTNINKESCLQNNGQNVLLGEMAEDRGDDSSTLYGFP